MTTTVSVFDGLTACEHAEAAAEAIRAINHLTLHDGALPYPSDAYRLLGGLITLAERLPQALQQTAQRVNRWQDAGELGIDPGTDYAADPDRAAAEAIAGLHAAAIAAGQLRDALSQARRAITYAHYNDPTTDEEEASAS
jgi:O-acetylhomoserine/O-acetylserine sulfhydrylase-like pyridoxal-dependent enzyme